MSKGSRVFCFTQSWIQEPKCTFSALILSNCHLFTLPLILLSLLALDSYLKNLGTPRGLQLMPSLWLTIAQSLLQSPSLTSGIAFHWNKLTFVTVTPPNCRERLNMLIHLSSIICLPLRVENYPFPAGPEGLTVEQVWHPVGAPRTGSVSKSNAVIWVNYSLPSLLWSWKATELEPRQSGSIFFCIGKLCWLCQAYHFLLVLFPSSIKWRSWLEILGFVLSAKFSNLYVHKTCQPTLNITAQMWRF